jgi:hypothetical protein
MQSAKHVEQEVRQSLAIHVAPYAVRPPMLSPSGATPGVPLPNTADALRYALVRRREITIEVTGPTSGRTLSIPVWFALDSEKLHLLPARGSDTQWYRNLLKNPSIRIVAGGANAECRAVPVTDPQAVSSVIEKFRAKYGDGA